MARRAKKWRRPAQCSPSATIPWRCGSRKSNGFERLTSCSRRPRCVNKPCSLAAWCSIQLGGPLLIRRCSSVGMPGTRQVLTDKQQSYITPQQTRLRLRAITFNNLGCYFKRRNMLHASLECLNKALKIEQSEGLGFGCDSENPAGPTLAFVAPYCICIDSDVYHSIYLHLPRADHEIVTGCDSCFIVLRPSLACRDAPQPLRHALSDAEAS